MKILALHFLVFACILLSGCATTYSRASSSYECEYNASRETLTVSGDTDEKMLGCFETYFSQAISNIIISSNGGRVDTAIKIAQLVATNDISLTINRACNSSCANYIMPVSKRIIVRPGAQILLHGSIDQGFAATHGKWAQEQADLQRDFANNFDIPSGWLLLRTPKQYELKQPSPFISGTYENWGNDKATAKFFLVEENFFKSCFPKKDIYFHPKTLSNNSRKGEDLKKKYAKKGIYPTGNMLCINQNNG